VRVPIAGLLLLVASLAQAEELPSPAPPTAPSSTQPAAPLQPTAQPLVLPPPKATFRSLFWTPVPGRPPSPYRIRLDLDIALLVGGITIWGATSFIGDGQTPPPWCGSSKTPPCVASQVNVVDRWAIRADDPHARTGADALAGLVPGLLVVFELADARLANWRGWLSDGVVIAQAVAWTGAIQDISRRVVRRPRPYVYVVNGGGNRDGVEAQFSFFSGHTSNVFAMATATAYTYSLRHPHSKWQWLVWSLALAGATTEPIVRVISGEHFPTDCIAGALVGVSTGLLFPAIHRKRLPVQLTATSTSEATMVGVAGRLW
jgi:membrane-associated phospholipid phosphatase